MFPASVDAQYAWSAAFVSYVMRIAGAGARFPYSASHSDYIDIAKQMALGQVTGWLISAERPEAYAPLPGDLICIGRGSARDLGFDDLPAGHFPGHCDIVVDNAVPGQISVVGGNVDDAVTLKHVPVTPDGRLATPDGQILDPRYRWMVVLRLLSSAPVSSWLPKRHCVGANRRRAGGVQRIHLGVGEHARAGDEPHAVRRLEREAVAAVRHHVDGELTVRPIRKLRGTDVERAALDHAE